MSLTLDELKQRLSNKYDVVDLLELLQISAEDLVHAFEDRIVDKQDDLEKEVDDVREFGPQEWAEETDT